MPPQDTIHAEFDDAASDLMERRGPAIEADGRDAVAQSVRRAWQTHIAFPGGETDLFEGLNHGSEHGVLVTVRVERMLAAIERDTGVKLPLTIVFQAPTLAALTSIVLSRRWEPFRRPFVLRPGSRSHRPLFLFPGLGGMGLDVVALGKSIGCKGPVYFCHPAGLDASQPLSRDLAAIVADHIAGIRSVQPHGPYQFLGYSYGGLVAIEIVRRLAEQGERTDFIGVLEPGLVEADWPYSVWLEYMRRRLLHHVREVRRLSPSEMASYAVKRLTPLLGRTARMLGNTTWWNPLEQIGLSPFVQQIWDAELDSAREYRMKWFDGKITLFASTEGHSALCDPCKLWPRYVREVEVQWINGDHMTILRPPSVDVLAREVAMRLPGNSEAPAARRAPPSV